MINEKKHILVVDDEEEIRFLLETKFYKLGYNVSVAATALQALQKIKAGNKFDLIICDLKMPKMNGIEFFIEIQNFHPQAQFLLITGQPEKDKLMMAMKKGVLNIMLKPVKHIDIVEKINGLIGAPERVA
ncbi:MAG: response regulator [Bdellovibrionaceae bacterium]|nr:response regulator [Pseudobdellovibrionaceae bacterium]